MERVGARVCVVAVAATLSLAAASSSALAEDEPLLASTPGQALSLIVGGKVRIAQVTRDGLASQGVFLTREPGRLGGRVGTEPVDLRFGQGRIGGSVGSGPVALDVSRTRERMKVAGRFGARAVAMELRPTAIHADIGPCSYSLTLMLGRYRGYAFCRGPTQTVELTVPAALLGRSDLEIAAMLTALLTPSQSGQAGDEGGGGDRGQRAHAGRASR
jgi:hypothetical protein